MLPRPVLETSLSCGGRGEAASRARGGGVRGLPQGKQYLLSVLSSHAELYLQLTESQTELVQILGATETLLFAKGN